MISTFTKMSIFSSGNYTCLFQMDHACWDVFQSVLLMDYACWDVFQSVLLMDYACWDVFQSVLLMHLSLIHI